MENQKRIKNKIFRALAFLLCDLGWRAPKVKTGAQNRWDDNTHTDQYTYLGVEFSKNCSWDAHINKAIQRGKAEVGRMDVILRTRT